MVDQEAWESMMDLPTDVLLRTTGSLGDMVSDMHDQWSGWIEVWPDEPAKAPFMFDATLDAADEFAAGPFIAACGWYRPAYAALRKALEGMTVAAGFAVRGDSTALAEWRAGTREAKFGNALDFLQADQRLSQIDARLGGDGLFRRKPPGILEEAYAHLCNYAHSRPGYTNVDAWQGSNGPVFIPKVFIQFWTDFCDTVALSYVLLAVGWSGATPPRLRARCSDGPTNAGTASAARSSRSSFRSSSTPRGPRRAPARRTTDARQRESNACLRRAREIRKAAPGGDRHGRLGIDSSRAWSWISAWTGNCHRRTVSSAASRLFATEPARSLPSRGDRGEMSNILIRDVRQRRHRR